MKQKVEESEKDDAGLQSDGYGDDDEEVRSDGDSSDVSQDSTEGIKVQKNKAEQLQEVKEEEEEHQTDEQQRKRQIFDKHRLNHLVGYANFNQKVESFLETSEFSWQL